MRQMRLPCACQNGSGTTHGALEGVLGAFLFERVPCMPLSILLQGRLLGKRLGMTQKFCLRFLGTLLAAHSLFSFSSEFVNTECLTLSSLNSMSNDDIEMIVHLRVEGMMCQRNCGKEN